MLKKTDRLARVDFLPFFKSGKRVHSEHLSLVYGKHPTFHASVVVSKKVSKRAVGRNTIRRRLYAHLRTLKGPTGGVYIVNVKPSFASLPRRVMHQEIVSLIERLGKPA